MENTVCSICGKTLDIFDLQNNPHIHKQLSYGSKFDGQHLDLDLCSDCFDNLIEHINTEVSLAHRILDRNKPNKNYNL